MSIYTVDVVYPKSGKGWFGHTIKEKNTNTHRGNMFNM